MTYYNVLSEDLYKSIIIIEHRDVYRFVTCCSKYCPIAITQDDNNVIIALDIYKNEIIYVPLVEIMGHRHYDLNDLEKNDRDAFSTIAHIKNVIEKYKVDNTGLTHEKIYDLSIKPKLFDLFDLDAENYILDFLSYTDFYLTLDDVYSNIVSEDKRQHIIKCCNVLINKRVVDVTAELNELKTQSENPEDHADIDTIIQMYHDAASEVDYSRCKKLVDYLQVWPPLLLPLPEKIEKFIYKISQLAVNREDTTLVDFMSIVDNSLTYSEMRELLDEFNTLQPDDLVYNQINLKPFKEYLMYKLNNEHK
jgi:hypothetical protein